MVHLNSCKGKNWTVDNGICMACLDFSDIRLVKASARMAELAQHLKIIFSMGKIHVYVAA